MKRKFAAAAFFFLFMAFPLWSDDSLSYIGMKVADLYERFGAPQAVFAARGAEQWQDDVVFRYAQGDFFIHMDRVWQVSVKSAQGVSVGEPKQAVVLALGNKVEDKGDHLLLVLPVRDWQLMLRVNFNNTNRVSAIYVYRPDY
jgi:hypothetical protein